MGKIEGKKIALQLTPFESIETIRKSQLHFMHFWLSMLGRCSQCGRSLCSNQSTVIFTPDHYQEKHCVLQKDKSKKNRKHISQLYTLRYINSISEFNVVFVNRCTYEIVIFKWMIKKRTLSVRELPKEAPNHLLNYWFHYQPLNDTLI